MGFLRLNGRMYDISIWEHFRNPRLYLIAQVVVRNFWSVSFLEALKPASSPVLPSSILGVTLRKTVQRVAELPVISRTNRGLASYKERANPCPVTFLVPYIHVFSNSDSHPQPPLRAATVSWCIVSVAYRAAHWRSCGFSAAHSAVAPYRQLVFCTDRLDWPWPSAWWILQTEAMSLCSAPLLSNSHHTLH